MSQKPFNARHGLTVNNYAVINGTSSNVSLEINASDAIQLPSGNNAQRPANTKNGQFRYNTETGQFEGYNGGWSNVVSNTASLQASIDGKLSLTGGVLSGNLSVNTQITVTQSNNQSTSSVYVGYQDANNYTRVIRYGSAHANASLTETITVSNGSVISRIQMFGNGMINFVTSNSSVVAINGERVWNAGNDGNGSGLDSDLWKGASYTVSTAAPTGGNDGDFWFQRDA